MGNYSKSTGPIGWKRVLEARSKEHSDIFRLLMDGKSDEEIMKELKISAYIYYKYKKEVIYRYAEAIRAKDERFVQMEQAILKERFLWLWKQMADKLLRDSEVMSGTEYANMVTVMGNIATSVYRLEAEGLRILLERKKQSELTMPAVDTNNLIYRNEVATPTKAIRYIRNPELLERECRIKLPDVSRPDQTDGSTIPTVTNKPKLTTTTDPNEKF